MSLRPLLEIANATEPLTALVGAVAGAAADEAAEAPEAQMSAGVRPYLLALLAEDERALGDRPALASSGWIWRRRPRPASVQFRP